MRSLYIFLIAVLIALSAVSAKKDTKFSKPPMKGVKCENEFDYKKMVAFYENKLKRTVARKSKYQQKCAEQKKQKKCEKAKAMDPKIEFLNKEVYMWKHRCAILKFKANRRAFYRFQNKYLTYAKKAKQHKDAFDALMKKAESEKKITEQEKKQMEKHRDLYIKYSKLAAEQRKMMQKLLAEHANLMKLYKINKDKAAAYAIKQIQWAKKVQDKLAEYKKTASQIKEFEAKYKIHDKEAKKHEAEHKKHHTAGRKQHDEAFFELKEKKHFDKKNKTAQAHLNKVKKNPVYKSGCSVKVNKCGEKHGFVGKKFRKCCGKCF